MPSSVQMKEFSQWPAYFSYRPSAQGCLRSVVEVEKFFSRYYGFPAVLLPSGRSALYHISVALEISRPDLIRIPEWSSHCLYNSLGMLGSPSVTASRGRMILVNHKWGYVHRLTAAARRGFRDIVEDSVDSIIVDGKGLFLSGGRYEVISLSKILGLPGGAVVLCRDEKAARALAGAVAGNSDAALSSALWREKVAAHSGKKGAHHAVIADCCEPFAAVMPSPLLGMMRDLDVQYPEIVRLVTGRYRQMDNMLCELNAFSWKKMRNSHRSRIPTVIPVPDGTIDAVRFKAAGFLLQQRNCSVSKSALGGDFFPHTVFPMHAGISEEDFDRMKDVMKNVVRKR